MSDTVRVRFAPSPSGFLHVGGARTALFNWLFARSQGGVFVLRVEDTDAQRSTVESIRAIITSMKWLGLDWDEGPDVGGPHGPYFQNERMDKYLAEAKRLLAEDKAYPCYCTEDELNAVREQQEKAQAPVVYNGRCAKLSAEERAAFEREGRKPAIRFRTAKETVVIPDLVKGPVEFDAALYGDLLIVRSNERAVYNFAVVVDDAQMKITHVIRGDEHLVNAPRQMQMYRALGYEPPKFAHLPLILGKDRKKLSKRDAAVAVGDYQASGHLPEAMINYIGMLGWSPGTNEEIFSRQELLKRFSLDGASSNPAVFDTTKLAWVNQQHLKKLSPPELEPLVDSFLKAAYGKTRPDGVDGARFHEMLKLVSDALVLLSDAPAQLKPFFVDGPPEEAAVANVKGTPGALGVLDAMEKALGELPEWTQESIKETVNRVGKELGIKGKALFLPVRAGCTGLAHGPDMVTMIRLLGRERVLANLAAVKRAAA
jgi:nondiscriminating glutamyl-tRNA synthetase